MNPSGFVVVGKHGAALLGFLLCSDLSANDGNVIYKLATGNEQGIYQKFGMAIRDAVNAKADNFRIQLVPSGGSQDNITSLKARITDLGFIQSDQASQLSLENDSHILGMASLYTSAVHVLVSQNESIESLDDLRGRAICLGAKNSGTHLTAKRILNAFSIYNNDFIPEHKPFSALSDFFGAEATENDPSVRGAFVTAGLRAPVIEDLTRRDAARLLTLPNNMIRDLLNSYSYYVPTVIGAATYTNQKTKIQTIGVRELLVCRSDLPNDVVKSVLEIVIADRRVRKLAESLDSNLNALDISERGMPLKLHEGASSYYLFRRLWASLVGRWIGSVTIIIGILGFWVYIYRKQTRFTKWIRRNPHPRLLAIFGSIFIVVTIAIYWYERDRTLGFQNLIQSFWSTALFVLSGVGGNEPQTPVGRAGTFILLAASLIFLGLIAGRFAAKYILQIKHIMPKNIQNHVIICNWNTRGDRIVRELHSEFVLSDTDIVVITDEPVDDKQLRENSPHYERVFFVTSDPKLHSVLRAARVHEARTVIILATPNSSDPDAHSALIALAVRNVCKEFERKDLRLVAETSNHRKIPHLKDAGVNTVICPSDYGMGVLAQSVIHQQIPEIYDRLLSYSGDTNEIYIVSPDRLPSTFVDKPFREICQLLHGHISPPVIPIGICRHDETLVLNPRIDPLTKQDILFEKGDSLVVIAYQQPDLRKN